MAPLLCLWWCTQSAGVGVEVTWWMGAEGWLMKRHVLLGEKTRFFYIRVTLYVLNCFEDIEMFICIHKSSVHCAFVMPYHIKGLGHQGFVIGIS